MKTKLFFTFLILQTVFFSSDGFAEKIEAASKIIEVVVFPDRALVTRRAEVTLPKGTHEIQFASLPPYLEEESLSAKGKGDAKVTLFGARLVTKQLTDPQPPRAKEIQEEIEKVKNREQQLYNRKNVVKEKHEFLTSIKAASGEQIGKDIVTKQPSVTDATELLNFLERELTASFTADYNVELELREVHKELDRLNRELQEVYGNFAKSEMNVAVDLEAETAGKFILDISYRVPGASWEPVYEARASSDNVQITFMSSALIRQNTGENWEDVALHLSTAKPAIYGRMPEVEPWFLKKYEPAPRPIVYRAALAKSASMDMMQESAGGESFNAPAAPMAEAEVAVAAVETKGQAVFFTLPKLQTVVSDDQPVKASIASAVFNSQLAFEISPRLSPYAYWRAKVTNSSEGILLAGQVQIFVDGAFIGSSWIKNAGPNEEFDLFLGIDERIKVERKELKAKVDVSVLPGLHGQSRTVDYEYLIKVENFRTQKADITLIDQLPVSQNDEIKIENVQLSPKPTEEDPEKPGVKRWRFELSPSDKKEIKMAYRVKYPASFRVEGL